MIFEKYEILVYHFQRIVVPFKGIYEESANFLKKRGV